MNNNAEQPAVVIVITGPDGERDELHIPPAPRMPLLRRFAWRWHCVWVGACNAVYRLRGGR